MNWIPRLKHRKLVVEGNLMDFSKPVPDKYDQDQRWISSRITGRVIFNSTINPFLSWIRSIVFSSFQNFINVNNKKVGMVMKEHD